MEPVFLKFWTVGEMKIRRTFRFASWMASRTSNLSCLILCQLYDPRYVEVELLVLLLECMKEEGVYAGEATALLANG